MGNITGASLSSIYNRLNGVSNYHPMEADTFSDWSIEAGDTVTVKRRTKEYESPIHSTKLVWRGQPNITVSSTGNKERESIAKVSKNKYNNGSGGIRSTKRSAGLYHEIVETDEYWRSTYEDSLNGLRGVVEQTASYWRTQYDDLNNDLHGLVEATASYWRNTQAQFTSVGYRISTVENTASGWRTALEDVMYGDRVTAASIATAFNGQGQAGVKIKGRWIELEGDVVADSLTNEDIVCASIEAGGAILGGTIEVDVNSPLVGIGGTTVDAGDIIVGSSVNGNVMTLTHLSGDTTTITKNEIANTLTFTDQDGHSFSFSKSTSTIENLTGSWSGDTLTVVTNPSTGKYYTVGFSGSPDQKMAVLNNGSPTPGSISGSLYVPYKVCTDDFVSSQDPHHMTTRATGTLEISVPAITTTWAKPASTASYANVYRVKQGDTVLQDLDITLITDYEVHNDGNKYNIQVKTTDGTVRYQSMTDTTVYYNGWGACYDTLDTTGTTTTRTLDYSEQATVSVKLTDRNGTVRSVLSRTYNAPAEPTITTSWAKPASTASYANMYRVNKNGTAISSLDITLITDYLVNSSNNKYNIQVKTTDGTVRYQSTTDTTVYYNGWGACYATLDTTGTTDTKTLDFSEQAAVSVKLTDRNGTVRSVLSRTYNAPAEKAGQYTAGWNAAVAKLVIPSTSQTSNAYITVKYPSTTVDTQSSTKYTISNSGNNAVKLTTSINGSTVTVAKYTHNKYDSGYVAGWNAFESSSWYTPKDSPPSGFTKKSFYYPKKISSKSDTVKYQEWTRGYSDVAWNVPGDPSTASSDPGSGYTLWANVSKGYTWIYFTISANGSSIKRKIKLV